MKIIMKKMLLLLFIYWSAGAGISAMHARSGPIGSINWDKVKDAVNRYNSDPCDENAKLLLDSVPKILTQNETGNRQDAVIAIMQSRTFYRNVLAGVKYLPETVFRLLHFTDGASLEDMMDLIQQMATKQPELYLRLLLEYEGRAAKHLLFGMEEVWGVPINQIDIYNNRIFALKTVTAPELSWIRDECIKLLENEIKRIENNKSCRSEDNIQ